MRLCYISLLSIGLSFGGVAGCESLHRAGEAYSAEWREGNIQERGLKHLDNAMRDPSPINGIAQIGGFLSYLITLGVGGILVRNAKSAAEKKAIEGRIAAIENQVKPAG